jgi:hypothetical protein
MHYDETVLYRSHHCYRETKSKWVSTYEYTPRTVLWEIYSLSGLYRSWDSSVGIATGFGLDGRVVRVPVPIRSRIFSSPRRSDRFRGPLSLLSKRVWGERPGRETDNLQLVPRSRNCGSIHPFSHTPLWRSVLISQAQGLHIYQGCTKYFTRETVKRGLKLLVPYNFCC